MEYTIKDLSRLINKSEQSLYKLIKKNTEFAEIVKQNSREEGLNHTKLYAEPCLEWLIKHYNLDRKKLVLDGVGVGKTDNAETEKPDTTSPVDKPVEGDLETYIGELESKVAKQKKRIKSLKADIERLTADNDRLLTLLENEQKQREGLLMTLVAEKREKHLMLEDPTTKRHWWQRKKD